MKYTENKIINCCFEKGCYIELCKDVSCENGEIFIKSKDFESFSGIYINKENGKEIIDFINKNVLGLSNE